jgi:hypothetical protein
MWRVWMKVPKICQIIFKYKKNIYLFSKYSLSVQKSLFFLSFILNDNIKVVIILLII